MNRQILSLMTAAMVLMTAFASCSKDNNSKKDDPGGGGGALQINATVVDGNEYNGKVTTVKAWMGIDGNEYVAASGKYANGGFKLTLPETVPAKYLDDISGVFDEDFEGTISDKKAKIGGFGAIIAYDSQDRDIGDFSQEDYENDSWVGYMYVDRDVTVKGSLSYYDDYEYWTERFDFSFTKGWNIFYGIEKGNEVIISTKKPAGTNYKWYGYISDYNWKKSPNDRQHPFSKVRQCAQK